MSAAPGARTITAPQWACRADQDTTLTDSDSDLEFRVSLEVSVPVHTALVGLLWRLLESSAVDPDEIIPSSEYRPGRDVATRSYINTDDFLALVV